jgi:predicted  nucleic acid-binding Zn-ribbon protein
MKEDLRKLLQIQDVDSRIDRTQAEMDEIPRERKIHQKELEQQEREFQREQKKLEDFREERKKAEENKKTTQNRLAEFKNKLLEMKTNEAYRSMLEQIKFAEKKVSDLDSLIIEKMYEEEEAEAQLEDARKVWDRNRKRFEKRQEILDGQLEVLKENMAELQAERQEVASGMNRRLLDKYQQLRSSGKGLVVVGLQNGNCGGCLTGIPPQTAVEISQGDTFICPICGRFVVWTEDSSLAGAR